MTVPYSVILVVFWSLCVIRFLLIRQPISSFYKPSGLLSAPTWTFARGIIGNPGMRLLCLWQEKHIIEVKSQPSTLTPFVFTMIYRVRMAGIAVLTWSQDTQPTSRAVCFLFLSFSSSLPPYPSSIWSTHWLLKIYFFSAFHHSWYVRARWDGMKPFIHAETN